MPLELFVENREKTQFLYTLLSHFPELSVSESDTRCRDPSFSEYLHPLRGQQTKTQCNHLKLVPNGQIYVGPQCSILHWESLNEQHPLMLVPAVLLPPSPRPGWIQKIWMVGNVCLSVCVHVCMCMGMCMWVQFQFPCAIGHLCVCVCVFRF